MDPPHAAPGLRSGSFLAVGFQPAVDQRNALIDHVGPPKIRGVQKKLGHRRHALTVWRLDWWSGALADLVGTLRELQALRVGFITSRLR